MRGATGAPGAVDGGYGRARRRAPRWALGVATALTVAGCSSGHARVSVPDTDPVAQGGPRVHVSVAGGCPSTLGTAGDVSNPSATVTAAGLAQRNAHGPLPGNRWKQ